MNWNTLLIDAGLSEREAEAVIALATNPKTPKRQQVTPNPGANAIAKNPKKRDIPPKTESMFRPLFSSDIILRGTNYTIMCGRHGHIGLGQSSGSPWFHVMVQRAVSICDSDV